MTTIRIVNVTKTYGPVKAVDRVTLTIESGELFFLLGPSGCGKTTLLRMIAGFIEPEEGDLFFDDQSMRGVPPRRRDSGMVFQSYALWPHRTVAGNVAYGLEVRGLSKAAIHEKVEAALKLVRLEGLGQRKPNQLSGGQQQRVALARALVIQPRVLLLDEPLSNLDARLRLEMREEIRRIHRETGLTMVYVTHDQKEALSLASRIAVMQSGKLIQVATPSEAYLRPATQFVADFLGDSNFVTGTVEQVLGDGHCRVSTPLGPLLGVCKANVAAGQKITCSLRPESLQPRPASKDNVFQAQVERLTFQGDVLSVQLRVGEQQLTALSLQTQRSLWEGSELVPVGVAAEQVVVLDK